MSATTPAVWYELKAAIGAAQAVSACALDNLPSSDIGNRDILHRQINHLGDLIGGLQIVLERAAAYADQLEA